MPVKHQTGQQQQKSTSTQHVTHSRYSDHLHLHAFLHVNVLGVSPISLHWDHLGEQVYRLYNESSSLSVNIDVCLYEHLWSRMHWDETHKKLLTIIWGFWIFICTSNVCVTQQNAVVYWSQTNFLSSKNKFIASCFHFVHNITETSETIFVCTPANIEFSSQRCLAFSCNSPHTATWTKHCSCASVVQGRGLRKTG